MYKVITFRSRELKKNTFKIAEESSSADFSSVKNSTYIIDGVEVREEDLTALEREDINAAEEFNKDGFYTAPLVADKDDVNLEPKKIDNKTKVAIAGLCVVILCVSVAVMYFISQLA